MRYRKQNLVDIMTKNRAEHRAVFERACENYRNAVITALDKALDDAKKGRKIHASIYFTEPVEHTRDYDRVLRMLDLTVEEEIELKEDDFAKYVLDDWQWKQQFLTSNTAYQESR